MNAEDQEQIKTAVVNDLKQASEEARREASVAWKRRLTEAVNLESAKQEVITELSEKESGTHRFLKHPVTLLALGFVFTTLLGTIVTSWWKHREWENEQGYLKAQTQCERERLTRSEEIKQKYEVKDEIIKRVAETNTAAEDILLFFEMDHVRQAREQNERTKYWQEATRAWRINEKILRQRLQLRFENRHINELFDQLTKYRGWVGINIDNQQERVSTRVPICREIVNQANACMGHVTVTMMPDVIKLMNQEILQNENDLRDSKCASAGSDQPSNTTRPAGTTSVGDTSPQIASASTGNTSTQPELNACQKLQTIAGICDSDDRKRQKPRSHSRQSRRKNN